MFFKARGGEEPEKDIQIISQTQMQTENSSCYPDLCFESTFIFIFYYKAYDLISLLKECSNCSAECNLNVNKLESFPQQTILNELANHSHPKSRMIKPGPKSFKKVMRTTPQAREELRLHYLKFHNQWFLFQFFSSFSIEIKL